MPIRRHIKVPDHQALREEVSRCQDVGEMAKVVQHTMMIDGSPGFLATEGWGIKGSCPLPDKCTIVLLKGSFQLGDEIEDITQTYLGLEAEGSKTLMAKSDSIAVWFPSVCCWDSSECALARKGQCRIIPGVVIPRDPKNPMWWERDQKSRRWWKWF